MFAERLRSFDAAFLDIEDLGAPMHVAVVLVFDAAPVQRPDGGLAIDRIGAFVESSLHEVPRYRQRLRRTPLSGHPVWVDDPSFNLLYHLRHTALPVPGDERLLKRLAGRVLSQTLDREKPLWEIWVVEGLVGNRFALIVKAHHCMVDGIVGVDLLTRLMRTSPDATIERRPRWHARPAPGRTGLLTRELAHRARAVAALGEAGRSALREPLDALRDAGETVAALREMFTSETKAASPLPINPEHVSSHRRFDWVRFELERVKRLKQRLGGTVNDVVLATVAGAMRGFLRDHDVPVDEISFRVMLPVDLRRGSDLGLGNHVATPLVPLPVDERDPRRRLERIVETTRALKRSNRARGMQLFESLADQFGVGLVNAFLRSRALAGGFNLCVTNVPGPDVPLYLLGARLEAMYPVLPLGVDQSIGIALLSYDGGLHWGLNADWDRVPDLHDLALGLGASFEELEKLAGPPHPRAPLA